MMFSIMAMMMKIISTTINFIFTVTVVTNLPWLLRLMLLAFIFIKDGVFSSRCIAVLSHYLYHSPTVLLSYHITSVVVSYVFHFRCTL